MPISKKSRQTPSSTTTSPIDPPPSLSSLTKPSKPPQPTTPSLPPSLTPTTFTDTLPLPTTLIFDLDYTLWPFWIDTHVSPPLKPHKSGTHATDRTGDTFAFYRDVPGILWSARERGLRLGVASRTHTPELARELLKMLVVHGPEQQGGKGKGVRALDFFEGVLVQIYPGDKRGHFGRMVEGGLGEKGKGGKGAKGGGEERFKDMVFFDDEARNRNVETELGVCFRLVRDGVTKEEVDEGVREWRRRRGIRGVEERGELE
ncbi:MAG: hypothetical protein Q9160_006359 [Pyrenula sp. 1 TL-2023]